MLHLSGQILSQLAKDVALIPGAGAAGGLGAGLIGFLDAKLMKGFDMVAEMVELEEQIRNADLVITGEGKIDSQTQYGKTPYGVGLLAKKYHKPAIAVAGIIESGAEVLLNYGIHAFYPISTGHMTIDESILRAEELLEITGEKIARTLSIPL